MGKPRERLVLPVAVSAVVISMLFRGGTPASATAESQFSPPRLDPDEFVFSVMGEEKIPHPGEAVCLFTNLVLVMPEYVQHGFASVERIPVGLLGHPEVAIRCVNGLDLYLCRYSTLVPEETGVEFFSLRLEYESLVLPDGVSSVTIQYTVGVKEGAAHSAGLVLHVDPSILTARAVASRKGVTGSSCVLGSGFAPRLHWFRTSLVSTNGHRSIRQVLETPGESGEYQFESQDHLGLIHLCKSLSWN